MSTKLSALVADGEAVMAKYMEDYDSSHDMHHVRRVRDMAVRLAADAQTEGAPVDMLVVELGAIFHDLVDHKYAAGTERLDVLRSLLEAHGVRDDQTQAVLRIVEDTGFSRERKLRQNDKWTDWHKTSVEFASVQDADRLDAMGAFGVMRAAAYASCVGHPLHDSDSGVDSAYQHFYDKLLKLKDSMRTPLGKQLAAQRHMFMESFLAQLSREYSGDS